MAIAILHVLNDHKHRRKEQADRQKEREGRGKGGRERERDPSQDSCSSEFLLWLYRVEPSEDDEI